MTTVPDAPVPRFGHVALLYADEDQYLAGTVPFIEDGLAAGEPTLVIVPDYNLGLLRRRLGGKAGGLLRFAPMEELGRNPAWIIPAWAAFLERHPDRRVRGVGEPIWAGRSTEELVEGERHEALLNVAFGAVGRLTLLCPYDTVALGAEVIDGARRNHPELIDAGTAVRPSACYDGRVPAILDAPLPAVPDAAETLRFDGRSMREVRRRAAGAAVRADATPERADDFLTAVSELASNTVLHGGGSGWVAFWVEGNRLVCEIRDCGRIKDPLAGRRRPPLDAVGGRGLWLVTQLCDLVQVRSLPEGQAVRIHLTV